VYGRVILSRYARTHKVLIRKPKGLRLLGRASCRRENSIEIIIKEAGWEGMNWILCFGLGTGEGML